LLVAWVPTVDEIDQPTWRLISISDSHPEQLHAAYYFLTGTWAVDRLADDPRLIQPRDSFSPERYRTAGKFPGQRAIVPLPSYDETPTWLP
jgi:hypothetical protein